MLRHHRGGLGEEYPIGVDEFHLRTLADEGNRLALNDGDANLIGKYPHHGGVLDPGNLFELLATFLDGDEEDVSADVFAEYGEHVGAADLSEAGGLDVSGSGNAEAGVVLEKVGHCPGADGNEGEDGDSG